MKTNNKLLTNKGFTIVESLVAIIILVLAITGATAVVQTSLSSYIFSKDQIVSFYLAQEAFEQIRNLRDENVCTVTFILEIKDLALQSVPC